MKIYERLHAVMAAELDAPNKSILFSIATRMRDEDFEQPVFASLDTIAADSGCSRSVCSERLRGLEAAGVIVVVSKAAQGRTARRVIDWSALSTASRREDRRLNNDQPSRSNTSSRRESGSLDVENPDVLPSENSTGNHQGKDQGKDKGNEQAGACAAATPADGYPGIGSESVTPDSLPGHSHRPDDNDGAQTPPPVATHPLPAADSAALPGRPADVPPAAPTAIADVSGASPRAHSDRAGGADGLLVRDEATIARIIAAVRARGSDARDIRDAAHEAAHAIEWNVKPPWTRERIHAGMKTKPERRPVTDEARARAIEAAVCAAVGEPYEAEGWIATATLELMRVCPVSHPHLVRMVEMSAREVGDTVAAVLALDVPAVKPKKTKAAKSGEPSAAELEAWGTICQHWQTLTGRMSALQPGAGNGATILDALRKVGAAKLTARFAAVVEGRLPAAARFREMWARSTVDPAQLCRTTGGALLPDLDRQIEQAALDAAQIGAVCPSGASEGTGATETRSEPQERSQRPQSPNSAWEEVQAIIRAPNRDRPPWRGGPRLHADEAEHGRRCAALRPLWQRWCEASNPFEKRDIGVEFVRALQAVLA